jgi:hypothetical protein
MTIRRAVAGSLVLLVLSAAGCGGGKASVSGTVTYQGKAVVTGSVVFEGPDGIQRSVAIDPDGTYRAPELPAGRTRVAVISLQPPAAGPAGQSKRSRRGGGDVPAYSAPPPQADPAKWFKIPDKYAEPATSGLAVELKAGDNTHHIELQ